MKTKILNLLSLTKVVYFEDAKMRLHDRTSMTGPAAASRASSWRMKRLPFTFFAAAVLLGGYVGAEPLEGDEVLDMSADSKQEIPPTTEVPFRLISSVSGITLQQVTSHADTTVTASWIAPNGQTVTVSGSPGATVFFSGNEQEGEKGYVRVDVQNAPISKEGRTAVDAYASAGRSVYQDALNVGLSESEAQQVATQVDSTPPIFNSWCVDVSGAEGNATGHVCDVQSIVQQNGADWYISDQITGTAHADWVGGFLKSFIGATAYGANNEVVLYAPAGTIFPRSCRSDTQTLSYAGVSWSTSATICPERIDPLVNAYGPGFGSRWSARGGSGYYVGIDPTDLLHSPPNASPSASLHVYISWYIK